jgi:hypothetical protein
MAENPDAARALAAARAVAVAHSVACEDAVVLAAGSNVMVHLRPAPVVARVMTGTAALHGDVERWLAGEVAVGTFLGERGLAVAPSAVLAPGPHRHDGLWMTFWAYIEHDASAAPPRADELGRALRELHAALAGFRGALEPLSDVRDWLDRLAAEVPDGDQWRADLRALSPTVFASDLPAQAIHGDASLSNLLRTGDGLLWNDLEDVCFGPVHWDVAGLVAAARDRGLGEACVADFLRAYGDLDLEQLDDFLAAHRLYTTIWQAYDVQRRRASTDGRSRT